MRKSVNVDFILNNWFGEPPEHSDNERTLIRHLYEPLREIERQRDALLEALRPFAAINASNGFTYKDVDRARAAIKAAGG